MLAQQTRRAEEDRTGAVAVLARLAIVLALGAAIVTWPYSRACGAPLAGYLFCVATLLSGSIWTTIWTWRRRMAKTHILSLMVIFWAFTLAAAEVLPRVGYTNPDATRSASWLCR